MKIFKVVARKRGWWVGGGGGGGWGGAEPRHYKASRAERLPSKDHVSLGHPHFVHAGIQTNKSHFSPVSGLLCFPPSHK
jgi:hypothetical protein